MKGIINDFLKRITSRKFLMAVTAVLTFVFADDLGLDADTKNQLLVLILGYIGVEGLKDIGSELKK